MIINVVKTSLNLGTHSLDKASGLHKMEAVRDILCCSLFLTVDVMWPALSSSHHCAFPTMMDSTLELGIKQTPFFWGAVRPQILNFL